MKEFSLILGDCEVARASIINLPLFADKRTEVQRVTPNLPQAMGLSDSIRSQSHIFKYRALHPKWDKYMGWGRREVQEGGDNIYPYIILMAESHCCMAETNI